MFERFTERARRVLFFARYEASQLGSLSIEPEHLLLGIIREGKGLTSLIFAQAHVSPEHIRQAIEAHGGVREKVSTSVEIPFSVAAKNALQAAAHEADRLLHSELRTEHLLLGLLRDEHSLAATLLKEEGLTLAAVRASVEEAAPVGRELLRNVHVVLVQVTVRPELLAEFEAALLHNAAESIAKDKGCLRFDVSQQQDDPHRWVLHEVYTDADAHAAHRQSVHFLAYNDVAERAVVEKLVTKLTGRHVQS